MARGRCRRATAALGEDLGRCMSLHEERLQVDHEQRLRQVPVAVAEIVLQVAARGLERAPTAADRVSWCPRWLPGAAADPYLAAPVTDAAPSAMPATLFGMLRYYLRHRRGTVALLGALLLASTGAARRFPKPAESGISPPDDVDPMAVWEYTPRIPRYD